MLALKPKAWLCSMISVVMVLFLIGCRPSSPKGFHEQVGWNAERFFRDPQVIELCRAIESNDMKKIKDLIGLGVNINAIGKGGMTPLLWAYPENRIEQFRLLLENGANPNVIFESDFGCPNWFQSGESVTHLASMTSFDGYFEAVFNNGGDPNLLCKAKVLRRGDPPLFFLIASNTAVHKKEKVQLLIDKGVNIDYVNENRYTGAMVAVSHFNQFDIALLLLQAGADYSQRMYKSNARLIHLVVKVERFRAEWTPQMQIDHSKLIQWLEEHGESAESARGDNNRWESWSHYDGEYRRKMDAEISSHNHRDSK